MKNLFLFSGLIFVGCISCENRTDYNRELLIGKWELQQGTSVLNAPIVEFYANGEYRIVNLLRTPLIPYVSFNVYTITGTFDYYKDKIVFTTASAEFKEYTASNTEDSSLATYNDNLINETEGSNLASYYQNNDSILNRGNAGIPFIISCYKSTIWTVIELTGNSLRIITPDLEKIVYLKK
jgi:hypothetical protein